MSFRQTIKSMAEVYCREFKLVLHDAGILIFFMLLPTIYPIIYSTIYNPEIVKNVPVVVIDNDRTPLSRDLVRNLNACDQAWVIGYAANLSEAQRAMHEKKCYAILEIPEGFNRKVGNNEQGNTVLYCDMGLLLRYRGFVMATTNLMEHYGSTLLTEKIDNILPLAETVITGDPLPIHNISMGNIRSGFDSFIMPGVLMLILQQSIILALGMAGGARRENPALTGYSSYNVAPSVLQTMIAQSLCYITILLVQIIFIVHYVPLIFKFPMMGNTLEIFAFIIPFIFASFGLGYTIQAFVTERESIFVIWVVTSLIFLLLSGLIWPLYDLDPVWKTLSSICPSTWAVEGYVKMNANGASLAQVSECYRNLWLVALGWWFTGWCVRKWIVRPQLMRIHKSVISR